MVMRLLTGTSGHMSSKQQKEFEARVCTEGETIVAAFRTQRDSCVFTDRRLLLEDVQGVTGRKKNLLSVPYDKIAAFEVETAGTADTDGELRIWVSGYDRVIKREFRRNVDVNVIQKLLAYHMK